MLAHSTGREGMQWGLGAAGHTALMLKMAALQRTWVQCSVPQGSSHLSVTLVPGLLTNTLTRTHMQANTNEHKMNLKKKRKRQRGVQPLGFLALRPISCQIYS